ncbi:hypothetical protein Bbelb_202000 [Branchiostoma belcheri]|nr:hypothetical protein Bbelb_202000 [Branchiostoma belcheri]
MRCEECTRTVISESWKVFISAIVSCGHSTKASPDEINVTTFVRRPTHTPGAAGNEDDYFPLSTQFTCRTPFTFTVIAHRHYVFLENGTDESAAARFFREYGNGRKHRLISSSSFPGRWEWGRMWELRTLSSAMCIKTSPSFHKEGMWIISKQMHVCGRSVQQIAEGRITFSLRVHAPSRRSVDGIRLDYVLSWKVRMEGTVVLDSLYQASGNGWKVKTSAKLTDNVPWKLVR